MAEQNECDKYIKCSKCRCKYINDDEHIKKDFGYNRLEERFKTCVKCRTYSRQQDKQRQWNKCLISSDDDEEVKETKSMLAIKTIGIIQMY